MTTTKKLDENIRKLIEKSGNKFQYEVISFFRNSGWNVLISPYYNDNFSDKPKEIDIIAEQEFSIKDVFGASVGFLDVRLFIECKYIKDEIIFWFDKKDRAKAENMIVSKTPLQERISNNQIEKHHHFSDINVAKLFSPNLNGEDIIYKALSQCLNSMLYYRNRSYYEIFGSDGMKTPILSVCNYPIIICNSFEKFYKIESGNGETDYSSISDNFQLEVNYAYLNKSKEHQNEYFLIDVLQYKDIESFLNLLASTDFKVIGDQVAWQKRQEARNDVEGNDTDY